MRSKILSLTFILSIIGASIFLGIVDSKKHNATWELIKSLWQGSKDTVAVTSTESVVNSGNSAFEEQLKPLYFKPVKLSSGDLPLNVALEEVGVSDEGVLGVPSEWENGGWYKESALAGQEGNIILDGHYDTNLGAPGAFWELKNLKVNDTVTLTDEMGRDYTYRITNSSYVDIQDSNRLDILNQSQGSTLTLVTCGGIWLPNSGTYSKRLIIKAELVEDGNS